MKLGDLIRKLPVTAVHAGRDGSGGSAEDRQITDVALLDGRADAFRADTLYFGYAGQTGGAGLPPCCVLEGAWEGAGPAADGAPAGSDWPPGSDGPGRGAGAETPGFLAELAEGTLFAAFNTARAALAESAPADLYASLLQLAGSRADMDVILDSAATSLGYALVLVDANFRVLAHSVTKPIPDKLWQENIRKGFCSYEFILAVREMGLSRITRGSAGPVEVSCSESPYRKFASPLHLNGSYAGFLLMITNERLDAATSTLPPGVLTDLASCARVIARILPDRMPQLLQLSDPYRKLLYDLLIGAPPASLTAQREALTFPAAMTALCVMPNQYVGKGYLREQLAENLAAALPGLHYTYFESSIAAVCRAEKVDEAALRDYAASASVRIGLSDPFSDISYFPWYFSQARTGLTLASRFGEPGGTICRYADFRFHDLLDHFGEKQKLTAFYHPAINALKEYDEKNGADLVHTLTTYLTSGASIKDTAAALFIHRNSLSYRLERIAEIGGVDLNDPEERFALLVSCRIAAYLGG